LTGSISYNLSWSVESFAEINGGKEFTPPFDRRHELQIASSYAIGENWTLGALCVVASGQTYSSKLMTSPLNAPGNRIDLFGATESSGFIDVNGSRLPGFQRLELNITRRFYLQSYPCQFSLRLLNSYGLLDPFVWRLLRNSSNGLQWYATLQEANLFPLYPAVEIQVKF
jgi:hypothetical protein